MVDVHHLLKKLWDDYRRINPQTDGIQQFLQARGETVVNDHIAFRTFSDERVSIDVLARPFIAAGYTAGGEYLFPGKHLFARHYAHAQEDLPRIFISELKLDEMSNSLQSTVQSLLDQIPAPELERSDLCQRGRLWTLDIATYRQLADESEYAGWLAAFGFRANHFTVLVNALRTIDGLRELNALLREQGYPLNTAGGEIKGTPADYLEQSSTLAAPVDIKFKDGVLQIPGCYYEFAQRYVQPNGELFPGFVSGSADKIFQSTDRR